MSDGSNPSYRGSGYATATTGVPTDDPADRDGGGPCACLQQHVYLVYRLGDLQSASAGKANASAMLEAVRHAQCPWNQLKECSRCRGPDCPQEVLLLFAVSIRTLLSSFQQMHLWDPEGGQHAVMETSSVPAAEADVSVGGFEVTGALKVEVVDLILRNALEQVLSALLYLQSRSSQMWASLLETTTRASQPSSGPARDAGRLKDRVQESAHPEHV